MQKRSVTVLLASALAVFVLAVTPAAVVFAEQGTDSNRDTTSEDTNNGNPGDETHTPRNSSTRTQITNKAETNDNPSTDKASRRFDARKLRACNNRKGKITGTIDRVVQRTQNQLNLFDKITARTEAFYVSKGKTLTSYDALVAAVSTAKAQAEADLTAVKAHSAFACDADDPTGDVAAFKAAVKQEIQDLKTYRTAVKNLIVGVKSAQGDA